MKNIKKDFPFFANNPELVYLDSAATAQKPQAVINRMVEFYASENAPTYRGIYRHAEAATASYEAVRAQVRDFIGAEYADEIIFTPNATAASNLIVEAWGRANLNSGDEVVLTELEHHAQLAPWMHLAQEKQITLKIARATACGTLDYDHLATLITPKTRLVAVTAVSNVTGAWVDLKKVALLAKSVDALVAIDACQAAPRSKFNLKSQNIDFLFFSGHKIGGPGGVGVLCVKRKIHVKMTPFWSGGGALVSTVPQLIWQAVPYRYEVGTQNMAAVLGLCAALAYHREHIALDDLRRHEAALCAQLIEFLQKKDRVRVLGPVDQLKENGHVVSFTVDGLHAHDIAQLLDAHNIAVRSGNHCAQPLHNALGVSSSVRTSFYVYNTHEDVQALINALQTIL